ncbi:CCA tRNA nucleotidyltransferase [bacterium]|nr:CCA tRNA nucleotidyltransferase [bacterium]
MPTLKIDNPKIYEIFTKIGKIADLENVEVYAVGGFVRDFLLGRKFKSEIDFVVVGDGIAFAKKVASAFNKKKVVTYERFGTSMFVFGGLVFEFVSARSEIYSENSRKPVVSKATLEADLTRRDFTINTLAIGLNKHNFCELKDIFGSQKDLANKIIKTPLDPEITFSEDPLRILRAIRFAAQLGFEIENKTLNSAEKMRERLKIISQERITDEILKVLSSEKPSVGLCLFEQTKVLDVILPELSGKINYGFVEKIANQTENSELRLASLFLNLKTEFSELGKRLKLPNKTSKNIEKLIFLFPFAVEILHQNPSLEEKRRFLRLCGVFFEDVLFFAKNFTSENKEIEKELLELDKNENLTNFRLSLSGEEVMEILGISEGTLVGEAKNRLEEGILRGEVCNSKAELRVFLSGNFAVKKGSKIC